MRELKAVNHNRIHIVDAVSGATVEFIYRMPTAAERVAFERTAHQWKKNKFVDNAAEARLEYGMIILVGFKDGNFSVEGQPISSDHNSEHYYPEWKTLVRDAASDLVSAMAMAVFQGSKVEESDAGEEDDQTSPFDGK